jgi:uncharacterized protein
VAEGVSAPGRLTVRLTPRGGRDAIQGWDGETLRVRVGAPPVEGAANEALVRLLASVLGVPRMHVRVMAGARSKVKILEVSGLSADEMRGRIESAIGAAGAS